MNNNKELTLYQIMSGRIACTVLDNILYVKSPTPEQRLIAQQVYIDILYETEFEGILTEIQMKDLMIANSLWSLEEETELSTIATRIDNAKEEMYRHYAGFQSDKVDKLRKSLHKMRIHAGRLFQKKHAYDIYTCTGVATIYQLQYWLAHNTVDKDGQPVIDLDDFRMRSLSEQYAMNRPADNDIRQISKIDTWKSVWNSSKGSTSVFGVSAVLLSEEQRSLIGWSRLYDNIMEAAAPPEKVVLEDDDLLDGWLIVQHHKNEEEKGQGGEAAKRHPGAQEIFIPVETYEDARRVEALNDAEARLTKQQRSRMVQRYGRVEEQHMPDSRMKIMMEAANMATQNIKR